MHLLALLLDQAKSAGQQHCLVCEASQQVSSLLHVVATAFPCRFARCVGVICSSGMTNAYSNIAIPDGAMTRRQIVAPGIIACAAASDYLAYGTA